MKALCPDAGRDPNSLSCRAKHYGLYLAKAICHKFMRAMDAIEVVFRPNASSQRPKMISQRSTWKRQRAKNSWQNLTINRRRGANGFTTQMPAACTQRFCISMILELQRRPRTCWSVSRITRSSVHFYRYWMTRRSLYAVDCFTDNCFTNSIALFIIIR